MRRRIKMEKRKKERGFDAYWKAPELAGKLLAKLIRTPFGGEGLIPQYFILLSSYLFII